MNPDGSNVVEVPIPPGFAVSGLQWSPDGRRLLLSSIAAVVSVAVAPGSPSIVHSSGELNLVVRVRGDVATGTHGPPMKGDVSLGGTKPHAAARIPTRMLVENR